MSLSAHSNFNAVVTVESQSQLAAEMEGEQVDSDKKLRLIDDVVGGDEEDISVSDRPPMDIVCVLDKSGSMGSDNKLDNLKSAVDYIRGELGPNDRMAVIVFNSSQVMIHNLVCMTDENKATAAAAVQPICAGGGTNILSGMQAALQILEGRETHNPISSVFLLTDGIDSSHMSEKRRVAKAIKDGGSSLFVYGFGNDHDSAHLNAIASAGEGRFTFIEESEMVVDAFGGALGSEKSIIATSVVLSIRTAGGEGSDGHCCIRNVHCGAYRAEVAEGGGRVEVFFRNLADGESRDVLVQMDVPAAPASVDTYPLLETSIRYIAVYRSAPNGDSGGDNGEREAAGAPCVVRRVQSTELDPSLTRHTRVDVQMNRMMLTKATEESLAAADEGDYDRAREVVSKALGNIKGSISATSGDVHTTGYVAELEDTLNNVRDADIYNRRGGRAMISDSAQTISAERGLYTKKGKVAMYQNDCSLGMQRKGARSKMKY